MAVGLKIEEGKSRKCFGLSRNVAVLGLVGFFNDASGCKGPPDNRPALVGKKSGSDEDH